MEFGGVLKTLKIKILIVQRVGGNLQVIGGEEIAFIVAAGVAR